MAAADSEYKPLRVDYLQLMCTWGLSYPCLPCENAPARQPSMLRRQECKARHTCMPIAPLHRAPALPLVQIFQARQAAVVALPVIGLLRSLAVVITACIA